MKQARLVERGHNIVHGGTYEIWDIGDGYGICVEFHPCPWDAGEPDAVAFPYDLRRNVAVSWSELFAGQEDATCSKAIRIFGTSQWRRTSMKSAETVELPKDRNGRTLHIGDEALVYRHDEPIGQGEVMDMTLVWLEPVTWYLDLYEGAVGDMRYRTRCGCFNPRELEIIEEDEDDIRVRDICQTVRHGD